VKNAVKSIADGFLARHMHQPAQPNPPFALTSSLRGGLKREKVINFLFNKILTSLRLDGFLHLAGGKTLKAFHDLHGARR
jgi:hypothetical protein